MESIMHIISNLSKKTILFSLMFIFSLINYSCEESDNENNSENGSATGEIIDTSRNPIAGVEVAIENTLVGYHATANGVTDTNGRYRIQLPTVGTFHASAYLNKEFNGKHYKIDLHCDSNDAFGNEGAVRNFQWKLTGIKPNPSDGYYGSTLELYNEPGLFIDENNIVLTLTPVGSLIDGSAGITIIASPVVTSFASLFDIPLGKYNVSATFEGTPLKLKILDSNESYNVSCIVEFEQEISTGTPIARLSYNQ